MPAIDADAHVLETERTWDYMDESEREFRPVVVSSGGPGDPGTEFWLIDGRIQPKSQNVGEDAPKASREMEDIKTRIRHMDDLGVSIQVLYPSVFLRPLTSRPEVELALCKSYNRWLANIWRQGKERLRWAAVLPLLSMDKALAEARFANENGGCALFVRGVEGEPHLLHPVLGADSDVDAHLQGLVDERIGEVLGAGVEADTGGMFLHDAVDVCPERGHLLALQPRFSVHSKLDGVQTAHFVEELRQRGLGEVDEILGRHSPDQALRRLSAKALRTLDTAAVDVIPDTEREV